MFAVACLAALLILTPILITVVIAESGSIVPAVGVWEANVQAVCLTRKLKVEVAEQPELVLVRIVKSRSTLKVDRCTTNFETMRFTSVLRPF